MFGMGFTELLFIAVIAILFLGPEKLPQAMVDIARFLKKIKGSIAETKEDLERELQISDLKEEMLSYKHKLTDMTDEVKSLSPKRMLESEINDINTTIKEANPMADLTSRDAFDHEEHPDEADDTIADVNDNTSDEVLKEKKPKKKKSENKENKEKKAKKSDDPYKEAVTFKKKRTPITDDSIEKEA